jgi:hypothetical protein
MVDDDEIVNVPVPRRYLQAVYRVLAGPLDAAPAQTETVRGWSREQFISLKRVLRNDSQIALLEMTAARPDKYVKFSELMERTGRSHPELRGDLAGFSQLCKKYGPSEQGVWPVYWKELDDEVCYSMKKLMADWWKEA